MLVTALQKFTLNVKRRNYEFSCTRSFKKYGTRTVVDHLSFEMNRPGVYALLGTNGAGKRLPSA